MKVLLDTNVVLDLTLDREPFFDDAKQIFIQAALEKSEIFVTSVTVINTFYTTRKERDVETAWIAVTKLLTSASLCLTTKSALTSAYRMGFKDYEDAVQCASAVAEGLDAIVTRNTKDFERSPIPVYSPAEFLAKLDEPGYRGSLSDVVA